MLPDTRQAPDRGALRVGQATFAWGQRTYIMGIINVTPDSFSGDGLAKSDAVIASALQTAQRCVHEGADILDIGGESTRPGAEYVSLEEEAARVVPVIEAITQALTLPVSVDSYRAPVVRQALDAGATMVNDVWGLRTPAGDWNEPLAALVAQRGVPLVLMHNRRAEATTGTLGGFYNDVAYDDLVSEVVEGLRARVRYAMSKGIAREQIIVDPGIGFGKTPAQNLVLMRRLGELRALGLPVLLGASRKSFIGLALDLPPDQRDEGTAATTALAVAQGVDIVRVHNIVFNARVARMCDAIVRAS